MRGAVSLQHKEREKKDRHNENKERLGSTLAKEIGESHRRVKAARTKMSRRAVVACRICTPLEERDKQAAPPTTTPIFSGRARACREATSSSVLELGFPSDSCSSSLYCLKKQP